MAAMSKGTCAGCKAEIPADKLLCDHCEFGDDGPALNHFGGRRCEYMPTPEEIEAACARLRHMRQKFPRKYDQMVNRDSTKIFRPPLRKQPL